MRLAIVVPRYGEAIVGGAETLARGLAEHLAAAGTSVEVLTTCARSHLRWKNEFPPGAVRERGLIVRRFPVKARDEERFGRLQQRILRGDHLSLADQLEWADNALPSPELYAHLERHGAAYDAVCFTPYLSGATLKGVRLVERPVLIPCLHDEPVAYLEVVRTAFERCRGFIFNSPPEAALAHKLFGIGDRPGGVVGLGFEPPPSADPAGFRRRHRLAEPILLYVGRKEAGKNVPLLIQYASRYRRTQRPDLTLVLAGDGPVTAPEATDGIRDLGYLSREEKASAYAAASVVCQPSRNESFSIVIMEAWLARAPVLVHADCAVTTYHVLRAHGGLAFGDYYEFAEALTCLLDTPPLRAALGVQGRSYVEREYAWPEVTSRLRATLERIVA